MSTHQGSLSNESKNRSPPNSPHLETKETRPGDVTDSASSTSGLSPQSLAMLSSTSMIDERRGSRKVVTTTTMTAATKIDIKNGIEMSETSCRQETKAVVHMWRFFSPKTCDASASILWRSIFRRSWRNCCFSWEDLDAAESGFEPMTFAWLHLINEIVLCFDEGIYCPRGALLM